MHIAAKYTTFQIGFDYEDEMIFQKADTEQLCEKHNVKIELYDGPSPYAAVYLFYPRDTKKDSNVDVFLNDLDELINVYKHIDKYSKSVWEKYNAQR